MPLQISPIDGSAMRHIQRFGVEIDVCPTSGGVWLDRSELDKIVAVIREEAANAHTDNILGEWGERTPPRARAHTAARRKAAAGTMADKTQVPQRFKKRGTLAELVELFNF